MLLLSSRLRPPKKRNSTTRLLQASNLPLLSGRLQLPIALRVDLLLAPGEHVLRGDVACGAVQSDVVVAVNISLHQTPCIIERQRRSWPDALPFERFVPTLDLAVRWRVERRGSDVRHARDSNELFEVLADELRPIVRDDPGPRFRVLLLGLLQDDLDVRLRLRACSASAASLYVLSITLLGERLLHFQLNRNNFKSRSRRNK
jgi:hypothetical protein